MVVIDWHYLVNRDIFDADLPYICYGLLEFGLVRLVLEIRSCVRVKCDCAQKDVRIWCWAWRWRRCLSAITTHKRKNAFAAIATRFRNGIVEATQTAMR
jgi:hypothetical protein